MQQMIIAGAIGYLAGPQILKQILAKVNVEMPLDQKTTALVAGAAIYALKPLPEGANMIAAGFLMGSALKEFMSEQ